MSCGVGHRCSLDPALLWLWYRPAAMVLIGPLAWEPPYATGAAGKRPKKKDRTVAVATGQLEAVPGLTRCQPDARPCSGVFLSAIHSPQEWPQTPHRACEAPAASDFSLYPLHPGQSAPPSLPLSFLPSFLSSLSLSSQSPYTFSSLPCRCLIRIFTGPAPAITTPLPAEIIPHLRV